MILSARHLILTILIGICSFSLSGQNYINLPPNLAADIINSSPFVPSPYYSYVDNTRYQFIYSKDELRAGGAPTDTGCIITSIAWHIIRTINASYYTSGSGLKGYTIRMMNVPDTLLYVDSTLIDIGPEYIVKNPFDLNASVIPDTGYTDLVFDQEFEWDGRGNILIDVCYGINDGNTPAPLGIFSNSNSGVAALSYHGKPDSIQTGIGTAFVTPSRPVCDTTGNGMYWFHPRPVAKIGFRPLAPSCKPRILPEFPEVCAGSQIQLTVTGAESYSWSHAPLLSCVTCSDPEVMPTQDTTIRVLGFKGSCVDSSFVRIHVKEPVPLTIQTSPEGMQNLCNGPVTLSINPGFTDIQWSNLATDSAIVVSNPGTFGVSAVDSLGCQVSADPLTLIRTNPPLVDILPPGDLYLCLGELTLSATPGLETFLWSNGDTTETLLVNEPGDYTLQATDAMGCIGNSDVTKVLPGYDLDVPLMAKDSLICDGDRVLVESLNAFTRYEWSNGETSRNIFVEEAGDYYLKVADQNGCEAISDTLHFEINYVPQASFTYGQPYYDYTVQFTNTSLYGSRYLWTFENGATSTEENPTFVYPYDDFYPVTLVVSNNCGNDTINMLIDVKKLLSVNDVEQNLNWELIPNPAEDNVIIRFASQTENLTKIELYNYQGQLVYSDALKLKGLTQKEINLSSFASGVYWVVVSNKDRQRGIRPLVVR